MGPSVMDFLGSSLRHKKSLRVVVLMLLVFPFSLLIFYWCHTTNSLALTAFGYLTFFNVGSLATLLISTWASKQQPTPRFSFGYYRINVLAVFSITILLIMFSLSVIKHSMGRIFEPPVVSTSNMFFALVVGLGIHLVVTCGVSSLPLLHASEAASRNWLQRALSDFGHTVSSVSPALGRILLTRLNPITLLVFGGAITLALTQMLIDLDELYLADVTGALFISVLICVTMFPLSINTAKILLQTAPQHILPLLDKTLREASTLDGVLGVKNEHFWTIAFGSYAGSLHVRVRRDANEQEVLTQLTTRLASQLNDLTIQVVKEDWTQTSGPSPIAPSPLLPPSAGAGGALPFATGPLPFPRGDPLPNTIAAAQRQKGGTTSPTPDIHQTTPPHPQAHVTPDHILMGGPLVKHEHNQSPIL